MVIVVMMRVPMVMALGRTHRAADVVPLVVVMIMVVRRMAVVLVGVGARLVLQPAIDIRDLARGIIKPVGENGGGAGLRPISVAKLRPRVENTKTFDKGLPTARIGERHLGQDQPVGHRDLAHRFRIGIERRQAMDGIDDGDNAVKVEMLGDGRVPHDGLHDGRRIGEAGRLDDDARQGLDLAGLHAVDQFGERIDQLAAHGAAQAAIGKLDDGIARRLDQKVVDADLAEFIDDHRRVVHGRILQDPVEKRRLSRAEKAGDDGDRNRPVGSRHGFARNQNVGRGFGIGTLAISLAPAAPGLVATGSLPGMRPAKTVRGGRPISWI